jgi:hypothetical protein
MPVSKNPVSAVRPPDPSAGREEVDAALVFDRGATRSLELADRHLAAAMAQFKICAGQGWSTIDIRMAQRAVDRATEAQSFAAAYQVRCRLALSKLLDRVADGADSSTWLHILPSAPSASDSALQPDSSTMSSTLVLASVASSPSTTSAIPAAVAAGSVTALVSDADVAAQVWADGFLAAQIVEDAVAAAARMVARAVEEAGTARRLADALAAGRVAATAAKTATDVQRRADYLAAAASTRGAAALVRLRTSAGADSPRVTRLARQLSDAAAARAQEAALAASIVARGVADAAATVSARCAADSAATRLEASRTAAAVSEVAQLAARAVADAAVRTQVVAHGSTAHPAMSSTEETSHGECVTGSIGH